MFNAGEGIVKILKNSVKHSKNSVINVNINKSLSVDIGKQMNFTLTVSDVKKVCALFPN